MWYDIFNMMGAGERLSSIIKIKNLTFSYSAEEERKTLDNVNLEIEAGQWVALIGHNGSGKSTLARCIDGLLMPESGSIEVDGLHLTEETVWDVRERIGMVFQNPDNQFVGADVEGDVAFGMENRGIPRAEMQKRVKEVLEAVDMTAFSKHEPVRLSGGQKQRVAIAGVLAVRPKIIIFDESTSMLDPEGKRDIVGLMRRLNDEENFTIISITHDIDEASLADRVIVLNDGRVIDDDVPGKIFASGDLLTKIGLDLPYPEALKEELKEKGIDVPNEYLDEEGMVDWLCRSALKN